MADPLLSQKDLQQLRETLRNDLQQLLDQQTRSLERLVKESPNAPRLSKMLTPPKRQEEVNPWNPVKSNKRPSEEKEHPLSVPKIDEDFPVEDTEVLTDVLPAVTVRKLDLGPSKKQESWGSPERAPETAAREGPRQSMFMRFKEGVQDFLQQPERSSERQAHLVRRKKPGLYGEDEQEEMKLDEEAYDVMNFYKRHGWAQALARSERFERITLFIISINAIYIGIDADNNTAPTLIESPWPYQLFDHLFCIFFSFELAVRFMAFENKRNCLRDAWFVFDTILVMLMVFETWLLSIGLLIAGAAESGNSLPTGPLRLLRLLRLSRLVRILRSLPELLTLVNGMRAASRAVTSALMLILGMNYVFSIVINMFLSDVTSSEVIVQKFSTLGLSMWSLLLHGTLLDGISDILEEVRALETQGHDWTLGWSMIIIFCFYVLLTNITVMNMLIGVVCEVVSEVKQKDEKNTAVDYLKRNLRELLIELDTDQNSQISKSELHNARRMPKAKDVLKELDVDFEDLIVLTEPLFEQDVDEGREQEVTREELLNVILNMRGDRDVRMEDLVRLRCDLRRYLSRQFQQLTSYFDGEVGNPLRQEPWP
ncbi:unnamed protein product [Durusdinium trenchii]|uniref:Ion transport domain-containing protein n=1 Tax=Durusdinium trenchii TaxID=1381693 RepID=A0ABP0QC60_9DINO